MLAFCNPKGCFAPKHFDSHSPTEPEDSGRDVAREKVALTLGADKVFSLARDGVDNVTRALQAENGGLGVDLCIKCSGAPAAFAQGIDVFRNRGVYLVPGQYSVSGGVEIQPQLIIFKALQIIGSSQYSMCAVLLGFYHALTST